MNSELRIICPLRPEGVLRLAQARTALLSWFYAGQTGATFVLHLADLRMSGREASYGNLLMEELKWLGLNWQEGPDVKGSFGPYRQSERFDLYRHYLGILKEQDLVYPCYCSEEALRAEQSGSAASSCSGECRGLSEGERRQLEAGGRKPAMRFRAGRGLVEVEDVIMGLKSFEQETFGDFVIIDSEGVPSNDFAQAVDSGLMAASILIRPEELLPTTAREMMLGRALGFDAPEYAHHAPVLGPDGAHLNDRHGVTSVALLRAQGYVPDTLKNYLACQQETAEGLPQILSEDQMARDFDLRKAGAKAAALDPQTMGPVNKRHLARLPAEIVVSCWLGMGVGRMLRDHDRLLEIIPVIVEHVERLDQLEGFIEMFTDKNVAYSLAAEEALRADHAGEVLAAAASVLEASDGLGSREACGRFMKRVEDASPAAGKQVLMPLRAALIGETEGPDLEKFFLHLDKNTLLHRIRRAREFIAHSA